MNKWAFVAVSAALAVAGVGASVSAEAHPYLTVGVDVPAVAVVGRFGHAPVFCGPYCYEHGRYWARREGIRQTLLVTRSSYEDSVPSQ